MSYAVISDVHSNLDALKAVLRDIHTKGVKKIFFLGDAVGYGPDPGECIDLLRGNCLNAVAGNHDWAVTDYISIEYFNENAKKAIVWTKAHMTAEGLEYLKSMPLTASSKEEDAFFVHASPETPDAWNYLFTLNDLEINFRCFEEKICFVGHSHAPFIAERFPSREIELHKESAKIGSAEKYLVNAGSVGQPRDGDPRACYTLIDNDRIGLIRVEYDVSSTQEKMRGAGLPVQLIERLSKGT